MGMDSLKEVESFSHFSFSSQVAGQTEMKETVDWLVYERAISREFSQWKIVARLPLEEEKK